MSAHLLFVNSVPLFFWTERLKVNRIMLALRNLQEITGRVLVKIVSSL